MLGFDLMAENPVKTIVFTSFSGLDLAVLKDTGWWPKINEEFAIDFAQPGIYEYFDMVHPWIAGTITVTAENLLMHLYHNLQMQLLFPSAFAVTEFPLKTDSNAYTHGQIVKVSGITSEKNISLQVKDPSGKTVLIRTLPAEGCFSYEMGLPNYFKIG